MVLDYSIPGVLKLDMTAYVKAMVQDFAEKLEGKGKFPWEDKLFKVDQDSKKLNPERAKVFHTFVMKDTFLCKRGKQDIQPGIAFLSTRTSAANEGGWSKHIRIRIFLKTTQDEMATMSTDDTHTIKCHVDASYAVYQDFKSHSRDIVPWKRRNHFSLY